MTPNKTLDRAFIYIAYLYIFIPVLIFVLGWIKWQISIPVTLGLVGCLYLALKENNDFIDRNVWLKPRNIIIALAILIIWLVLSGIGGWSYQTEDFQYRNAIFNDMVNHSWPVTYRVDHVINPVGKADHQDLSGKTTMLTYYICFWFPAACIGKLFGLAAGKLFLYLWAFLGMSMVFYFTCRYINKFSVLVLIILLFFGNIYFLGSTHYFPVKDVFTKDYTIWSQYTFYTDSVTSGVYWIYNQCITSYLILLLVLNNPPKKNIIFIYIFLFTQGPWEFVGLFPFVTAIILKDVFNSKATIVSKIMEYISIQNVLGVLIVFVIFYLYVSGNSSAAHITIVHTKLKLFIEAVLLSFFILWLLLLPKYKSEPFFYIILIVLLLVPNFQVGYASDFCLRVSIPSLFILMLYTIKLIFEEGNKPIKKLVVGYTVVCMTIPALATFRSGFFLIWNNIDHKAASVYIYNRSSPYHYQKNIGEKPENAPDKNYLIQDDLQTMSNPNDQIMGNFMSDIDNSKFYKYLAKHE